ncbi:MAG: DUF2480 family protein [Bacteroidota bacterium]
MSEIINRVASSGLLTVDLEDWLPEGPFKEIDLKSILWQGLILREQDLKDFFANTDYSDFEGSFLNVHCSEDVILPQWLYALISSKFSPYCKKVVWGSKADLLNAILLDQISQLELGAYTDQRVVVKGCASVEVHPSVYMNLVSRLQPVVKSLMYGEPCSTVPIYKKPKEKV